MAIEIIAQSNWIDYVDFNHDSGEVSTGTSFTIHFLRSIAVDSFLPENFRIYDVDADAYFEDPWMGIVPARDYSYLNMILNIYLELPLEVEKTYRFYIQDLEDGSGDTMPTPHIVQFLTSPVPSPVDFRLDELPAYIDDQSIIPPSIAEETGEEHPTEFYIDESSPPDGTMQVDIDDTTEILISFTSELAEPEEGQVRVYSRAVDRLWHPWVEITDEMDISVSGTVLSIALPLDATPEDSPHYLDTNTQYSVVLSADLANTDATPVLLGEETTISFYAELQPLYVDPLDLAEQFPDMTTEELYLAVYKASLDAYRFGSLELAYETMTDLPYAAQEYTRLRAIYLNAMSSEESASQMQLADLLISTSRDWLASLKDELDRWQYELEIQGGSKRLDSFTKARYSVNPPEQNSDYTGSQSRKRNSWWD